MPETTQAEDDAREEERDRKLVKAHVAQLAEHFDTVVIFANRHRSDDAGTTTTVHGTGNWYARYGAVKEWLIRQEAGMLPPG